MPDIRTYFTVACSQGATGDWDGNPSRASDEHECRPFARIGIPAHRGEHCLAQRVCGGTVSGPEYFVEARHQFSGRLVRDVPERHDDCQCAGEEESAGEAEEAFGGDAALTRAPCAKNDQVRMQLHRGDLFRMQAAVITGRGSQVFVAFSWLSLGTKPSAKKSGF